MTRDEIMGEKEFFDNMKNINQHLSMHERFLLIAIAKAFKESKDNV